MIEQKPFKKWIDLGLLLAAFVLGYLIGQVLEMVWAYLDFPYHEDWPIQLPSIIGYLTAFLTLVIVKKSDRIATFLNEVAYETSKVVWPAPKETGFSTVVIIIMVAIATVFLFLYDWFWGSLTKAFFDF